MEGFKYVDIFATKGVEYLVAIAFLVMLIYFWRALNKSKPIAATSSGKSENRISLVDWFRVADDYYYHQGHSWVAPESASTVRVGIDDFAQKLVGKPSRINVPRVGSILRQGEKGMVLEIDGKNIDILSPVSGEVIEVNNKSLESTDLLNKAPYEEGWLFKIRSDNLGSNLNNLLHGSVARAWIQDTVDKLSTRITSNYGVVMQDGGVIRNGFIKELAPDNWEEVAADFFLTSDR